MLNRAAPIIFQLTLFIVFTCDIALATLPSYSLRATNIVKPVPNAVEFDIMLLHTNADSSVFEYAGGQYFFDFNLDIGNGGLLVYSIVGSDLPPSLQPRNPTIYVVGGEMQLRLSMNPVPAPGNGYIISSSGLGTKIVRMRLETTESFFNTAYFQLRWRNGPANPYTKIFSYIDSNFTEITNSQYHNIDSLQIPLPVDLAEFVSSVSQNNTDLKWTTNSELNNSGFAIERNNGNEWKSIGFVNGSGNSNSAKDYYFRDAGLEKGVYKYRLRQLDYNGNYFYYNLGNDVIISAPEKFALFQNYPNPFNSSTVLNFNLPYDSRIKIILFDIAGREAGVIEDGFMTSGYHSIRFNSDRLATGTYLYRLEAASQFYTFTQTRKLTVIK